MLTALTSSAGRTVARTAARRSIGTFSTTKAVLAAEEGQAEVVLVGCGAPNRGMGWYHAVQMLEKQ